MTRPQDKRIDPERPHEDRPFDKSTGFSGQDYNVADEAALRRDEPAGTVAAPPSETPPAPPGLPPEAGRRASFDPKTGAVRGSGSGAGGGQSGEDFDSDDSGGGGVPAGSPRE